MQRRKQWYEIPLLYRTMLVVNAAVILYCGYILVVRVLLTM